MSIDLADEPRCKAPSEVVRLIPSQFPPINAFEQAASTEDLAAVMELEDWTNDRLAGPRLAQLPQDEWVYGRPNASIVMASFLHGSPTGQRFTTADLGAWYASTEVMTAALEVANGIRKELAHTGMARLIQTVREYCAQLTGEYVDIFGRYPEYHDPDDATYPVAQSFGQQVRVAGAPLGLSGIRYESVRHSGHGNWVCFRPRHVRDVMQRSHFELDVPSCGKVVVRAL